MYVAPDFVVHDDVFFVLRLLCCTPPNRPLLQWLLLWYVDEATRSGHSWPSTAGALRERSCSDASSRKGSVCKPRHPAQLQSARFNHFSQRNQRQEALESKAPPR